jgi:uncharacterized repeat protein (TIGR03847 family)
MPTIVHGFDWPERIIVGTIGAPGSRSFYLQVQDGARVVSLALEKEQSAVLAETIGTILDELMASDGNPFSVPATTPVELVDNDPLAQPVEPEFRTGTISLGWDPSTAQIVIEAFPIVDADDESDYDGDNDSGSGSDSNYDENDNADLDPSIVDPAEMLIVRIPVGSARAFATRTLEVVGAGRPLCPLCGNPMDPDGHTCSPITGLF